MDLLSRTYPPDVIAAKTAAIHEAVLRDSPCIRQPNFEKIGTDDLARLFDLYDRHFFDGWLAQAVKAQAGSPLLFRLSSTMTRTGGKTTLQRRRRPDGGERIVFEIAIASRMLFMTFRDVQRPVVVCGLTCRDRLQALQRLLEHEIIHLAELLAWGRSSCSARRFKTLSANLFGHTGTKHALVTAHERAKVQYGVGVGTTVEFEFEGRRLVGLVNRVHQRATVLVEDADGMRYSDGKRYAKFYVPLAWLRASSAVPGPPS